MQLQFFGWWRPPGAAAVSSGALTAGRLSATLALTARDLDNASDSASRTLSYDLLGPGDVTGLAPGAVVHTYPSAGALNVEVEKAVYAELAAPDLPWRHTVALPQGKALRPWMVLLVGTPDEIEVAGTTVRLQPSVLDAHPLTASARGAHVEEDDSGRTVARLISTRALLARPRPRRRHRAGVHGSGRAGVADAGRRGDRPRRLPPLDVPHQSGRGLRRDRRALEAAPGRPRPRLGRRRVRPGPDGRGDAGPRCAGRRRQRRRRARCRQSCATISSS